MKQIPKIDKLVVAASVIGATTPDRGGRAKVYCELTPAGKTALMKIQKVNAVM